MSYTSKIMAKLDGDIALKALFPAIALMTLPKNDESNYISFRKTGSSFSSCLDDAIREVCSYEISLYAKEFKDLEDAESLIFLLFHGKYLKNDALGFSGLTSITSVLESEEELIKMYKKTFTLEIK